MYAVTFLSSVDFDVVHLDNLQYIALKLCYCRMLYKCTNTCSVCVCICVWCVCLTAFMLLLQVFNSKSGDGDDVTIYEDIEELQEMVDKQLKQTQATISQMGKGQDCML